jgi:hypothetical protein
MYILRINIKKGTLGVPSNIRKDILSTKSITDT